MCQNYRVHHYVKFLKLIRLKTLTCDIKCKPNNFDVHPLVAEIHTLTFGHTAGKTFTFHQSVSSLKYQCPKPSMHLWRLHLQVRRPPCFADASPVGLWIVRDCRVYSLSQSI